MSGTIVAAPTADLDDRVKKYFPTTNESMQSIQVFNSGAWNVKAHVCNEVPYFCAKDIAKSLGYKNCNQAVLQNTFEEDRFKLEDLRGLQDRPLLKHNERSSVYITESSVWALVLGSQKGEAKVFKKWLCSEVLP